MQVAGWCKRDLISYKYQIGPKYPNKKDCYEDTVNSHAIW